MIPDAIFNLIFVLLGALVSLFPTWDAPSWMDDMDTYASTLGGYGAPFASWIPWSTVITVVTAEVALVTVVVGVRFALWLWKHLPWVGG